MFFDQQFRGNVLIVGRTNCGKTYFFQMLAINDFWGDLKKTEWVSYIKLSKIREAQLQSCFKCDVEFHCPKTTNELEKIIEEFKVRFQASETTGESF